MNTFVIYLRFYTFLIGIISILLNVAILIIITLCKAATVGSYRVFLILYVGTTIFCAAVSTFFTPMLSVDEYLFIFYASGANFGQTITSALMVAFCLSIIALLNCLMLSFIHRYCGVCRPSSMYWFRDKKMVLRACLFSFVLFVFFCSCSAFWLRPDPEKNQAMVQHFHDRFGVDAFEVPYLGIVAYGEDEKINREFIWCFVIRVMGFMAPSVVIFYCGLQIILTLRKQFTFIANSKESTHRQYRLFLLVLLQSMSPVISVYLPLSTGYIFSLIRYRNFFLCDFISVLFPIAHLLDPIIIFCCVTDYRVAVKRWFRNIGKRENSVTPSGQQDSLPTETAKTTAATVGQ